MQRFRTVEFAGDCAGVEVLQRFRRGAEAVQTRWYISAEVARCR